MNLAMTKNKTNTICVHDMDDEFDAGLFNICKKDAIEIDFNKFTIGDGGYFYDNMKIDANSNLIKAFLKENGIVITRKK